MADYNGFTRTNYFGVTDESKFRQLMAECAGAESQVLIFEEKDEKDKTIKFGFGCYSSIVGIRAPNDSDEAGEENDDCDYCLDAFHSALQELVVEGDAILITEIGYEKLRYLAADCVIITCAEIRYMRLEDKALAEARTMLENPNYSTRVYH